MNLKALRGYYSTRHNLKYIIIIIIMIKKNTYKNIRRWKIENVCHGIKAHVRPSDVTATPKRNLRLKIF